MLVARFPPTLLVAPQNGRREPQRPNYRSGSIAASRLIASSITAITATATAGNRPSSGRRIGRHPGQRIRTDGRGVSVASDQLDAELVCSGDGAIGQD